MGRPAIDWDDPATSPTAPGSPAALQQRIRKISGEVRTMSNVYRGISRTDPWGAEEKTAFASALAKLLEDMNACEEACLRLLPDDVVLADADRLSPTPKPNNLKRPRQMAENYGARIASLAASLRGVVLPEMERGERAAFTAAATTFVARLRQLRTIVLLLHDAFSPVP